MMYCMNRVKPIDECSHQKKVSEESYEIRLMRRGKNKSAGALRTIHLLSLYNKDHENYHIFYISDIESFLSKIRDIRLRNGSVSLLILFIKCKTDKI